MEELAQIFAGATIFGAKAELKKQGKKLGTEIVKKTSVRTSRGARAAAKKMSKALKMANSRYRNKNGSLRKGKTQKDIMKLAQRLRKKM